MPMESIQDLPKQQERFRGLATTRIQRPGVDSLLDYLEKQTNFFEAPSSTNHHLALIGGLVEHSLNVYDALTMLDRSHSLGLDPESMCVAALFHDACKGLSYKIDWKWVKPDHRWEKQELWVPDNDRLPLGHGEKSVIMILPHLALKEEEALAIRWHMGAYEPGTVFGYPTGYQFQAAVKKHPLVPALHIADMIAAQIMEK